MRVFRVQHKSANQGPYNFDWKWRRSLLEMHEDCPRHPTPRFHQYKYLYGFMSMEDLITWFYEWLGPFAENGFVVVEYFVPDCDVQLERSQCSFDPTRAQAVNTITI